MTIDANRLHLLEQIQLKYNKYGTRTGVAELSAKMENRHTYPYTEVGIELLRN